MPFLSIYLLPIILSKVQKTSPGLEPRTVFRGCNLCSCNFLAETTFVLASFFYRAGFPSYMNHIRWESKPGQFFGVVAFVSVISPSKQTTFALAPFFYRAWLSSYRNHLNRESKSGQLFGVMALVSVISSSRQITLVRRRSSIMLSFRATVTALTGNRT
jgi:hypothetical protein